jgi:hypothetical protein
VTLELLAPERAGGPFRCDLCGRFIAADKAVFSHEFGDYGVILSTEVECPRHRAAGDTGAAPKEER